MSDHLVAAKGEISRAIEAGKADDHPGIGYQVGEMMAHTINALGHLAAALEQLESRNGKPMG